MEFFTREPARVSAVANFSRSAFALISVRLFYSLLLNFSIFSVLAQGAERRLNAQFDRGALVRFTNENGQVVAGPEPVVRWQGSTSSVLNVAPNSVKLALTPGGLTAVVTKGNPGGFGELVFTVDLENTGNDRVTGTLLPPLSLWRDSSDAISSHSPEFLMLTSSIAEIGTLGVHRSWSPGAEFMAIFVRIPITKWNVLGCNFDEAGSCFYQPSREQTAEPEALRVIDVIALFRLQAKIKGFGGRRIQ
jgi:hypothetical protein